MDAQDRSGLTGDRQPAQSDQGAQAQDLSAVERQVGGVPVEERPFQRKRHCVCEHSRSPPAAAIAYWKKPVK